MQSNKRPPKAELAKLLKTLSISKTADHYGVRYKTVKTWTRHYGIAVKSTEEWNAILYPDAISIDQGEVIRLSETTPIKYIAKKFGVSHGTIKKILDRHNIPTKPRGYWSHRIFGDFE